MQVKSLFDKFKKAKAAAGRSENTLRQYSIALESFGHFLNSIGRRQSLAVFTPAIFEDYCIYLKNVVKQNTAHQRIALLGSFCSWLQAHGLIQRHPVKIIDTPKKVRIIPDILSLEESHRLEAIPLPVDETALRGVLCYAGLRNDEVCGLDRRDVALSSGPSGMLYVRQAKGDSARPIPVDPRLRPLLHSHLAALGDLAPEDPIFRGPRSSRMQTQYLRRIVTRWGYTIGRRHLLPHLLRHSFATHWIELGGDAIMLQMILGHASFDTTKRYIHLAQPKIAAEMERMAVIHGNT